MGRREKEGRVWVRCHRVLRSSTSVSSLLNLAGNLARAGLFVRFLSVASDFGPSQEAAKRLHFWRPLFWSRKLRAKLKHRIISGGGGVEKGKIILTS